MPAPPEARPFPDSRRQKGGAWDGLLAARALAFDNGRPRSVREMQALLDALSHARKVSAADVSRAELAARYNWSLYARPKQRPPAGAWRYWCIRSGRGFGKTRAAAEETNRRAQRGSARYAGLFGRDAGQIRGVMIEGEDGILACSPPWFRPRYEPTKRLLTWPNGVRALTCSADEPDQGRGHNFDWLWVEEASTWRYPAAFFEGADLSLRKGLAQGVITFTPKPVPLIIDLLKGQRHPETGLRTPRVDMVVVGGSTFENAPNLSPTFLATLLTHYQGTRLAAQELNGDLLEDVEGALLSVGVFEAGRVTRSQVPHLKMVVVAVDPTEANLPIDECGIVVAGRGDDDHAYALDDRTVKGPPHVWAAAAIQALDEHRADLIVLEETLHPEAEQHLRLARRAVPIVKVHASQGKLPRARPVAHLFELGRAHHVVRVERRRLQGVDGEEYEHEVRLENHLARLESEWTTWAPGAPGVVRSPGRLDASVWAFTYLMRDFMQAPGQVTPVSPVVVGGGSSRFNDRRRR